MTQTIPARKSKILRFRKSERMVHWALAIPFLVCYSTALILVLVYNPDPGRPYRAILSWTHRLSGVCLIVLPPLAIYKSRGDVRVHFQNIRQAWAWTLSDIRWIALMGLAAVSKKIQLPDQGKFNAAEKINFMMLVGTYPLYIITGLNIWLTDVAFVSWVIHFGMAVLATPLLFGHLYMAMLNPGTRVGLQGMISGYVDRKWAKHHYKRWYQENFEGSGAAGREAVAQLKSSARDEATHAAEDFDQALEHYDTKHPNVADLARMHYLLGVAYEEAGWTDRAIRQYTSFLDDFHTVRTSRDDLQDARGRLERLTGVAETASVEGEKG